MTCKAGNGGHLSMRAAAQTPPGDPVALSSEAKLCARATASAKFKISVAHPPPIEPKVLPICGHGRPVTHITPSHIPRIPLITGQILPNHTDPS